MQQVEIVQLDELVSPVRPIPGFPDYEIWEDGTIVSFKKENPKIMKPGRDSHGYLQIGLCHGGWCAKRYVHQLVLIAFKGGKPDDKSVTRHMDGNKYNNHRSNLEWGTQKENVRDMHDHGRANKPRGEKHRSAVLTEKIVMEVRSSVEKTRFFVEKYGAGRHIINMARARKSWKHLP